MSKIVKSLINIKKIQLENEAEILIAELCDSNYGYYIWPSSILMSRFIYENRSTIFKSNRSNILELGAGTSLPSIVARKYCDLDKIIITDNLSENDQLKSLIEQSLELNNLSCLESEPKTSNQIENRMVVSIQNLNWCNFDTKLLNLPKIDFLIGSDVFFDSKYLVVTVAFLIKFNNPNLIFFTTYEVRSSDNCLKLLHLFEKYSLKVKQIELKDKSTSSNEKTSLNVKSVTTSKNLNANSFNASHEIKLLQINK